MLKSHLSIHGSGEGEEEEEKRVEEEEEKVIEVQEEVVIERHLKKSEVSIRLSFLGKTADGDGYTYLKATLTGMSLTHIDAINCFKDLQFLDVSDNSLRLNELQAVAKLPYLVLLQADKNKLNSAELHRMPYLQVLILNNNQITTVNEMFQPELTTLEVGFNKIQKLSFSYGMPNIRCLDFRNNQIIEFADFNFPKLDSLYLANNNIVSLVGLQRLVNLRILHVRNNPIRLLDGFHEDHEKLTYINMRNCKVTTLKQVKKLRVLKNIETLILKGCPYMGGTGEEDGGGGEEDSNELRVEVLAVLPRLKRINKGTITPEEREEAKALMLSWVEEGEKEEEEIEDELLHEEYASQG